MSIPRLMSMPRTVHFACTSVTIVVAVAIITHMFCYLFLIFNFFFRRFRIAAPAVWNSIPVDIRACTSVQIFRTNLTTFLLKKIFPIVK